MRNDLPKEVEFIKQTKDRMTFVLQYAPQTRTIFVIRDEHTQEPFRLAFPYTLFLISFTHNGKVYDKTCVTASNKKVTSLDDPVFRLPMSNIYRVPYGVGLCMADVVIRTKDGPVVLNNDYTVGEGTLSQRLTNLIGNFWCTYFTGHDPCRQPWDERVKTYYHWKHFTKEDPSFATTVRWAPLKRRPVSYNELIGVIHKTRPGPPILYSKYQKRRFHKKWMRKRLRKQCS